MMKKHGIKTIGVVIVTALISLVPLVSAKAQTLPAATGGTVGRIAKFVTPTTLGNSLLFEGSGRIGLGTTTPLAMLDVRGNVVLWSAVPSIFFLDTTKFNARSYIRSSNGGLSFVGEERANGDNPSAFLQMDSNGRLGIGTSAPQRAIQIGPDTDAMFTIEPSDGSPDAGYIRFGDGTGWQLNIGRSRNRSGGPLLTREEGVIMQIADRGAIPGVGGYVMIDGVVELNHLTESGASPHTLCLNSVHRVTLCSSSRRYKTDIKPFSGGLQLINRLEPVSFTWKEDHHPDIGLIAEDVAKVEPRMTFNNQDGAVEGVNYSQVTTALINAVKEQQDQLKQQQQLIEELRSAVVRLEAGQP